CVCVLVAATLYTFYWNRLFAAVVGLLLRIRFWNQGGSSIWIRIGSIHFSLLAGRILLKDVAYHSSNQTINVVKAQITWRYWLRATATEDDLAQEHVGGEDFNQPHTFPSCRIKVTVHGFEWFLYNKTAAYDHIVSQMQASMPPNSSGTSEPRHLLSRTSGLEGMLSSLYPPSSFTSMKAPPIIHAALNWIKRQMPYIDSKDLLPISIAAFKCAIVCGNKSTPDLMVAECHRADGTFGIVPARSMCDLYKQLLNLRFQNTVVHLVENPSYHGAMPDTGNSIREHAEASSYADRIPLLYLSHAVFAKVWRGLRLSSSLFHPRQASASEYRSAHSVPLKGFHSSLDENDCVTDFTKLEYAIERRIMETPTLELSYYADVVGEVPAEATGPRGMGLESYDIGNGDLPPEWGIDFVIHNGVIRYGPWADRQRVHLQRTFFPAIYHDLVVSEHLKPGDKRIWTSMKVFIELRGETSLILPFREGSKDWQWDDHADCHKHRTREPAFLRVTAGDSSSINYLVPMVIGPDGYESRLEVHLDSIQVTSSLNDSKLVTAESCRVHAALPAALRWNAERKWTFTVLLRQPVISLLRDHINMFMDLSRDWTSGPPAEWHQFVPIVYLLEVDLFHFELKLYANDQNIIDKPLIKDENTILTLRAPRFHSVVTIPANNYRPEASLLPFLIEISDLTTSISLPKWNTLSLYNQGKEQRVLHARSLRIQASYYIWAEVHPGKVDQFNLHISVNNVSFKALGWVIRYSMVFRENYFGTFTHFTTLGEYLDKYAKGDVGDPVEQKYRAGKTNSLQVTVSVTLQSGSMLLPAGLPGYEKYSGDHISSDAGASLLLTFPELQLDLRSHDHFMDMSLNIGEIKGSAMQACLEDSFFRDECHWTNEMLIIDGIDITTNRLFGPPPRTRTYVCVWEISFGSVKTLFSVLEARIAIAVLDAFRINYTDLANAPAGEFSVRTDPDLTFVKFSLKTLNATFHVGRVAVDLDLLHGLTVHYNDLQGQLCGKLITLRLPLASLKALVTSGSSCSSWSEAACMDFDSNLELYTSSTKGLQSNFLQEQDILTGRADALLSQLKKARKDFYSGAVFRQQSTLPHPVHLNNLYLPQLSLPLFCARSSAPQQRQIHQKSDRFTRWSLLSNLSESDGEDIPEADRDARVARNRILRPVTAAHIDAGELTVSDESSDNEDSSDGDSSDSDVSRLGMRCPSKPLLLRYRRVVRRYDGGNMEKLHSREGSPFTLVHNPLSATFQKPERPQRKIPLPLFSPSVNSSCAIRLESTRGELWVTPLIILVASCLRDEFKKTNVSAEILLDTFMARYLTNFTRSSPLPSSAMPSFDITLHSLTVHVTEQVHYQATLEHPSSEVVTDIQSVDLAAHCFFTGFLIKSNPHDRVGSHADLQTGCQSLSINLSNSASTLITPRPEFCLLLEDIHASLIATNLAITCKKQSTQIGPSDPEYIVSLVLAAKKDVDRLAEILHDWRADSSDNFRVLVRRVLTLTKEHAAVDPLSIIQPSFLVQRGLPHALRTDTSFKFLFNMRFALRNCGPLFGEDEDAADEQNDRLLLRSYLSNLIVDLDEKAYSPTWEMVYPTVNFTLPRLSFPITFASCSFGSLRFTVLSISHKTHSYLSATALHLKYHSHASTHLLSQASLADHPYRQSIVAVDVVDLSLVISPRLIDFAQRIVRVQRRYHVDTVSTTLPSTTPSLTTVLVQVGTLNVQAGAENLTFELGGSSLDLCSSILVRPDIGVQSNNTTLGFSSLYIRALSKVNISTHAPTQDILSSLTLTKGNVNVTQRSDQPSSILRLVFSLEDAVLSVPRSALRLYRFIEEWKTDFLPGFEVATESLMSEIKGGPSPLDTPDLRELRAPLLPCLLLNGTIASYGVILQIMRGTWLSWIVRETTGFISSMPYTTQKRPTTFGFQSQSQALSISYKSHSVDDLAEAPRVKVSLPALALTGHQGPNNVDLLVALEFVNVKLKPSHWDSLLAVQQKFGRDFTELMDFIQETRRARHDTSEILGTTPNLTRYSMHVNVEGFRVGLEGPASTLYLECKHVVGDIIHKGNYRTWKVRHRDIALSLLPRTGTAMSEHLFNCKHRSAFIIIDVVVSADGNCLAVLVPKIHAVMQPSSIGELGDFVDYQQAELLVRRRQRATELEAFKQKTRTILKTFEAPRHDAGIEENASWLMKHSITVDVERIGVAFPLSFDQSLEFPGSTSHDIPAVRAFVFSVRRIRFNTQRGEIGYMTTKELSFQFTDRFRQWVSSGFTSDRHTTQNCLCYPEMKIHLRSDATQSKRRIWITGNVSGFVLDLDSSISDYVFSLIDVYRQGRERMERLAHKGTDLQEPESSRTNPLADDYLNAFPALYVFATLVFDSGQIRISSSVQQPPSMSAKFSAAEGDYESTTDIETINLPVLSAWIEYRASAGVPGVFRSTQPPILIFKAKIHSSQNTLNSNLLPFVTQITDQIQLRMRKSTSRQGTRTHPIPEHNRGDSPRSIASALDTRSTTSSLQINFSLRIDKSTLELTCQPDVNVIAALRWDSGGFVVSISPGAHRVTFTGSVDGLTVGLKHGFLSEDCVNLAARNLAFSLAFSKLEDGVGSPNSSISLLVSTDITGGVRFSRLQDILCFKAVWLDRIPLVATQDLREEGPNDIASPLQPHNSRGTQECITAIALYIRRTEVTVDLGQSICAVTLNLKEMLARTRISDNSSCVSLSVADVSIIARGNISGYVIVPNFIFQTIRRTEEALTRDSSTPRLLELTMTSGALAAELESEQQRLLIYRADPVQVDIHDDWSLISSDLGDKDRPLLLAFTVHGQGITALATIATIPKLMLYMNRFKAGLAAQRLAASRESEAFRSTQMPQPSNPLTDVASAFFQSARNRIKDAEMELSHLVRQQMSFRLEMLRFILFPRTMADGELASFVGRDVHASLHRTVQDGLPSRREIHLSFTTLNISKFSQFQSFLPTSPPVSNDSIWIESLFKGPTESNIVGLPPMKMLMITEETTLDFTKHLLYDFYSTFQGRGERKLEDIYITLNVALYSWLTGLRKNLSREMDQLTASTNNISGSRKKVTSGILEPHPTSGQIQLPGEAAQFSAQPQTSATRDPSPSFIDAPRSSEPLRSVKQSTEAVQETNTTVARPTNTLLIYETRERKIQRLTLRQLGEATPDVMHPFFMKKSGFNLEDSLPQYVHEYATIPLEKIMEVLLNIYSKQLPNDK
ncbi:hypothetical protein J3A83DRAFT_4507268, partial [Scleroderma citrinum]